MFLNCIFALIKLKKIEEDEAIFIVEKKKSKRVYNVS